MQRYRMLIGGEWVEAEGGATFESENPYLGAAWALIPKATPGDVDRAVEAAFDAFRAPGWRRMSASARGALLQRLADVVAREADRLAEIETRDNGKLITEMRAQLRYLPQWFRYFGGLADKVEGRVIPIDKPGVFNFTREEPYGVVAAITPWNSPSCSPPGSSPRRSPPATPWCGSPPSSPRSRRSSSAGCSRRRGCRPASSTS